MIYKIQYPQENSTHKNTILSHIHILSLVIPIVSQTSKENSFSTNHHYYLYHLFSYKDRKDSFDIKIQLGSWTYLSWKKEKNCCHVYLNVDELRGLDYTINPPSRIASVFTIDTRSADELASTVSTLTPAEASRHRGVFWLRERLWNLNIP